MGASFPLAFYGAAGARRHGLRRAAPSLWSDLAHPVVSGAAPIGRRRGTDGASVGRGVVGRGAAWPSSPRRASAPLPFRVCCQFVKTGGRGVFARAPVGGFRYPRWAAARRHAPTAAMLARAVYTGWRSVYTHRPYRHGAATDARRISWLRPMPPTRRTSIPYILIRAISECRQHRRGGHPHWLGVASPRPWRSHLLRPARPHGRDAVYLRP